MNKFETEYKNQIAIELPDLWDRIEAGVDAYEAAKNETVTVKTDENIENKITAISRKRTFVTIVKVLGAAACLFIVINVFRFAGNNKNMATSDAAADAGAMYFNSTDSAATADEAPMYEDTACEAVEEEYDDYNTDAFTSSIKGDATATNDAVAGSAAASDDACEEATECEPESTIVDYDVDSVLANGIVLYAAGQWTVDVENMRGDYEYDDLAIISDLFECDNSNAASIQSIFRKGNIAGVEYGFYKALSPEVENYMDADPAFDGIDREQVAITIIETADSAQYVVFTMAEANVEVLEIVQVN